MEPRGDERGDVLRGVLLGTLVGDALGLPREGLGPDRAKRIFGGPPLRHRLVLGRGMGSDDTDHACMTAQALLAQPRDPDAFARSLGWRLRGWFLTLPAGIGWATVRACMRLLIGFSPKRSGVFSAGNGPAMRAPILGACLSDDPGSVIAFTDRSTRLTHTHPMALDGAVAISLAAAATARERTRVDVSKLFERIRGVLQTPEMREAIDATQAALTRGASVRDFAAERGLTKGVTGFVLHTVPIVLFAWLRHLGDFRRTVEETILLGGDADTTGAIVGGLAGATCGASAIPPEWLAGVIEAPRTVRWITALGDRLGAQLGEGAQPSAKSSPLRLAWPLLLPRNLAQLAIVLLHGFRRLLPPY